MHLYIIHTHSIPTYIQGGDYGWSCNWNSFVNKILHLHRYYYLYWYAVVILWGICNSASERIIFKKYIKLENIILKFCGNFLFTPDGLSFYTDMDIFAMLESNNADIEGEKVKNRQTR